jgi:hypothetical protein
VTIDIDHKLRAEYGREGAKKIIQIAFEKAPLAQDYESAIKWASQEYEYELASEEHGCGFVYTDPNYTFKDQADFWSETFTLEQYNQRRAVEEKLTSLPGPSLDTSALS